ncbi:hypothetical protein BJM39_32470, partial [Salmonella enterica subsp. enterica serovar Javiana]
MSSTNNTFTPSHDVPTVLLDWGTIKWAITPDTVDGATITFGEVIVNPGQGHAPHTHENADEVIYVIEGEGTQTVGDGDAFDIKAGDTIFIPKATLHSTYNTTWRQLRLVVMYTPGGEEK